MTDTKRYLISLYSSGTIQDDKPIYFSFCKDMHDGRKIWHTGEITSTKLFDLVHKNLTKSKEK